MATRADARKDDEALLAAVVILGEDAWALAARQQHSRWARDFFFLSKADERQNAGGRMFPSCSRCCLIGYFLNLLLRVSLSVCICL